MPNFLEKLCEAASVSNLPLKIQPVDDGSGAKEAESMKALVKNLQPKFELLKDTLFLEENQGKGGAIYSGWDEAEQHKYGWLGFVDADGAISPEETIRLLVQTEKLETQSKTCLWAVRVRNAGTKISRTWIRKILGNMFRILVRCIFSLPVKDTQCGLKCLPIEAYQQVRPFLIERRFVFDLELAAYLKRAGFFLKEVPISWNESPGTTLNLKSAFRMLLSLFAVRLRLFAKNS